MVCSHLIELSRGGRFAKPVGHVVMVRLTIKKRLPGVLAYLRSRSWRGRQQFLRDLKRNDPAVFQALVDTHSLAGLVGRHCYTSSCIIVLPDIANLNDFNIDTEARCPARP